MVQFSVLVVVPIWESREINEGQSHVCVCMCVCVCVCVERDGKSYPKSESHRWGTPLRFYLRHPPLGAQRAYAPVPQTRPQMPHRTAGKDTLLLMETEAVLPL